MNAGWNDRGRSTSAAEATADLRRKLALRMSAGLDGVEQVPVGLACVEQDSDAVVAEAA